MVQIALRDIIIGTETVVADVVVVVDAAPRPTVAALDAKVVIALARQFAHAGSGLQHTLRQGDAGRYAVFVHLTDGYVLVRIEIVLIGLIPGDSARKGCQKGKNREVKEKYGALHAFFSDFWCKNKEK